MRYRHLQKIMSAMLLMLFTFYASAFPETIGNITWKMTPDDTIAVKYHIEGTGTYTVSLWVSTDGGSTFSAQPKSVSGDIGKGIAAGISKSIEWDVFNDVKMLSGDVVLMLSTQKEAKKPFNKLYVIGGSILVGGVLAAMNTGASSKSFDNKPPVDTEATGTVLINVIFPE